MAALCCSIRQVSTLCHWGCAVLLILLGHIPRADCSIGRSQARDVGGSGPAGICGEFCSAFRRAGRVGPLRCTAANTLAIGCKMFRSHANNYSNSQDVKEGSSGPSLSNRTGTKTGNRCCLMNQLCRNYLKSLAALEGLEPPTQGLGRPRSIHLNYRATPDHPANRPRTAGARRRSAPSTFPDPSAR